MSFFGPNFAHFSSNFFSLFFSSGYSKLSPKITLFGALLRCKLKKRHLATTVFQNLTRGHFTRKFGQIFGFFDFTISVMSNCVCCQKNTFFGQLVRPKAKKRNLPGWALSYHKIRIGFLGLFLANFDSFQKNLYKDL